uniref:Glucagon / GIP / secretin / VIP family domain-containing protein n=1 Tax=Xenopus tropicalis TaxID=8364 RepID=A0A6I8SEC6_XENTR
MKQSYMIYLAGAVFLIMAPPSLQVLIQDSSDETRWQEYQSQSFTSNIKRHSEGTFSSDLTRYLDKMKAKDFVQWLMNKRFSSSKRSISGDLKDARFLPDISMFRFIQLEKRRPQL